jgi:hypothetical protein
VGSDGDPCARGTSACTSALGALGHRRRTPEGRELILADHCSFPIVAPFGAAGQYYGGPLGAVDSRRVLAVRRGLCQMGVRWERSGDVGWDAFPPLWFFPCAAALPGLVSPISLRAEADLADDGTPQGLAGYGGSREMIGSRDGR